MADCQCMDSWDYYPKEFNQQKSLTFTKCDPSAPDSDRPWCYLQGGQAASKCEGAQQATGGVVNDQHYWKYCQPDLQEFSQRVKAKGKETASTLCDLFEIDDCQAAMKELKQITNGGQMRSYVNQGLQIVETCMDCLDNPEAAKCKQESVDVSLLLPEIGNKVSCTAIGDLFEDETVNDLRDLSKEFELKGLRPKVDQALQVFETCYDCLDNPEAAKCQQKSLNVSFLPQEIRKQLGSKVSCATLGNYFENTAGDFDFDIFGGKSIKMKQQPEPTTKEPMKASPPKVVSEVTAPKRNVQRRTTPNVARNVATSSPNVAKTSPDVARTSPNVADDPCECIPVTEHENERYYGCDPFSANTNKATFAATKTPWCQTKNPDQCEKKVPYTNFINVLTSYAGMSNVDYYHPCGASMPADQTVLPSKPSVLGYKWIDHYYDPITGKLSRNEDGTVRRRTKEEKVKALEENFGQLKKSERDWNCHVLSKELSIPVGQFSIFDQTPDVNEYIQNYCRFAKNFDVAAFTGATSALLSAGGMNIWGIQ